MCLEGSLFLGAFIALMGGVAVAGYYGVNKFFKKQETKSIVFDEVIKTE